MIKILELAKYLVVLVSAAFVLGYLLLIFSNNIVQQLLLIDRSKALHSIQLASGVHMMHYGYMHHNAQDEDASHKETSVPLTEAQITKIVNKELVENNERIISKSRYSIVTALLIWILGVLSTRFINDKIYPLIANFFGSKSSIS